MIEKKLASILIGTILPLIAYGTSMLFKTNNNEYEKEEKISNIGYPEETKKMHELLNIAEENSKLGKYRYALFDARIVFENALKLYIDINKCEVKDDNIIKYLFVCEDNSLIDDGFIDNLHVARKTCNCNSHEIDSYSKITPRKAEYVINQISELLKIVDESILNNKKEALLNA